MDIFQYLYCLWSSSRGPRTLRTYACAKYNGDDDGDVGDDDDDDDDENGDRAESDDDEANETLSAL